nr:hemolysin family protein [bacterium]
MEDPPPAAYDNSWIGLLFVLCMLLMLSSYFSASEMAFSTINRIRLKSLAENGNKRAARVLHMAENFDRMLSTCLIGNNIVNIASATIATVIFTRFFGNAGATYSTIVMTVVVLIFGEILPKSAAKRNPESYCMRTFGFFQFFIYLLLPLNFIFMGIKKGFDHFARQPDENNMTEQELLAIVDEVQSDGTIDEHEGDLIRSAIGFSDRDVIDILTPRVDIVAVDITDEPEEIARQFVTSGYSRLPVYRDNIDHMLGVLHEKDFYGRKPGQPVESLIKELIFVSQSIKIAHLLRLLQQSKLHMAVVTDDFGGTAGIVTMEDILEQLVGEIWDEHDEITDQFTRLPDGSYRIDGSAPLERMFSLFDIDMEYDATTVNGWVMGELEKVPSTGDEFTFEGLHAVVTATDGLRTREVIVRRLPQGQAASAG